MSKSEWVEKPAAGRDDRDRDELDDYVRAFEHAYHRTGSADPAGFLPPSDHPLHTAVLRELVRVDLEYGWERGHPKPLADYRRAFPELESDHEGFREIAFEEFRLRRQAGESPTPEEYRDQFGITIVAHGSRSLRSAWGRSTPTFSVTSAEREFPADIPGLPKVGDDLLGFRLVGELGRGSFGRVYLARQGDLADRPMVLKVTAGRHDESQTLARLRHDNIVPVYSSHSDGALRAVCMPYLGSVTLRDVFDDLSTQGTLPGSGRGLLSSLAKSSVRKRARAGDVSASATVSALPEPDAAAEPNEASRSAEEPAVGAALREAPAVETLGMLGALSYVGAVVWMASRLADGLAHAHERGILHRDMKPANILLTDDGRPMLLDFNLAEDRKRWTDGAGRKGEPTALGGTLAYMAPEHLDAFRGGARPVDARSDLYSFGVIVFEMLTGRPPFPLRQGARTRGDVLTAMIADREVPPPGLRRWNPAVSPAVESVVRRCLEPDPAKRYGSARELAEDLSLHLAHLPLRHADNRSRQERAAKWARRNPRLTVLVLVLAAVSALWVADTLAVISHRLAQTEAHAAIARFRERTRAAEYLLNVWMRSEDKRREGLAVARQALGELHALDERSWWARAPASRLSAAERGRVRCEAGELMLTLAWSEAKDGAASGNPTVRANRLMASLDIIERAEACFAPGYVPAVVWRQRADVFAALGDPAAAQRLNAQADDAPLTSARDHTLMGLDLARRGRWAEALSHFQEASRLDSDDYWASFGAGVCHERLEHPRDAKGRYGACVAVRKDHPAAWFNLGLLALRAGEFDEAKTAFEAGARLVPDDPAAVTNLALVALMQKRYGDAAEGFTRALAMRSPSTRLYFLRAEARRGAGDRDGAKADTEMAIAQNPTDELSWVSRGQFLLGRNDLKGALAAFDGALSLEPRSYFALINKAHVLSERLGRTEDSIRVLDRVLELFPGQSDARVSRGVLQARLGRVDTARADAEKARNADPSPPILYKAACVYALTSRWSPDDSEKALGLLRSSAALSGFPKEWLDDDPDLQPIRSNPGFQELAARVKAKARTVESESALLSVTKPIGR